MFSSAAPHFRVLSVMSIVFRISLDWQPLLPLPSGYRRESGRLSMAWASLLTFARATAIGVTTSPDTTPVMIRDMVDARSHASSPIPKTIINAATDKKMNAPLAGLGRVLLKNRRFDRSGFVRLLGDTSAVVESMRP
ncbi:MAG: hypothetical protein JO100_04320 [Pseudonocardia sp.]|nr:hypothetical protein [Pseudonocardia sp.]